MSTINADSTTGYLHSELVRVTHTILAKFINMSTINAAADITEVNFKDRENQHPDYLIAVGMAARTYLAYHVDDPYIASKFLSYVRSFYEELATQMLKRFLLNDTTLQFLGFLHPENCETVNINTVIALSTQFGAGMPDAIQEELVDYQLTGSSLLPPHEPGIVLNPFLAGVASMKTPLQKQRFQNLTKLAFAALSLPHSNADPERAFSMLKKIQREDREKIN